MSYQPHANLFGGYSQNDGSVDFYGRINSVLNPSMTVVDLGAGRAEWFEDDTCSYRWPLRLIKGREARVIALGNRKAFPPRLELAPHLPFRLSPLFRQQDHLLTVDGLAPHHATAGPSRHNGSFC